MTVLNEELKTYEAQKSSLLAEHENLFVLIKGFNVVGVFGTKMEAIHAGYEQLGNVPFLVRQILEKEPAPASFLRFKVIG